MTPDQVLERLDGVRSERAGQWNARCPAHHDRHASLSVGVGEDGRVLLHCHAGCTVLDVLDALGLGRGALLGMPADTRPVMRRGRLRIECARAGRMLAPSPVVMDPLPDQVTLARWRRDLVSVEPWLWRTRGWRAATLQRLGCGWDGRRLAIPIRDGRNQLQTVVRYRPGGHPKMLALRGRDRGLFPGPETIDSDHVWLVEGESDAIAAHELGLPAAAVPGVAKWHASWPERLAGRRVTVMFDCDDQGRTAARLRARQLAEAGVQARVADLAPGYGDGYDLGDALITARRHDRMAGLLSHLDRARREAWAG